MRVINKINIKEITLKQMLYKVELFVENDGDVKNVADREIALEVLDADGGLLDYLVVGFDDAIDKFGDYELSGITIFEKNKDMKETTIRYIIHAYGE